MSIENLMRKDIFELEAYSTYSFDDDVILMYLNENPWPVLLQGYINSALTGMTEPYAEINVHLNRYPEDQPKNLISKISKYYNATTEKIIITSSADEGINSLIRLFCVPGKDEILVFPPSYSMYELYASLHKVKVKNIELLKEEDFSINISKIISSWNERLKIIFICSPNNPTGNLTPLSEIEMLCGELENKAIIVVDEAYLDFARAPSSLTLFEKYPNLVVLKTFSKAFGLAGIRCGMLFADEAIISQLKKVLSPYALSAPTIAIAESFFERTSLQKISQIVNLIVNERDRIAAQLNNSPYVKKIWPTTANFIFLEAYDSDAVIQQCAKHKVIIKKIKQSDYLSNCIRISIGTPCENDRLLSALGVTA